MYATLCWRCWHILGLVRTPTWSEDSDERDARYKMRDWDIDIDDGLDEDWMKKNADESRDYELSSDEDDDEGDTYPEWLEVQITHTSRAMILQWARWAKHNIKIKDEEKKDIRMLNEY